MIPILKSIDFGNETADDTDVEELLHYFVEQSQFKPFIDPSLKLRVAAAKKGVGKSALFQWGAYTAAQMDPESVVIKCRGADLVGIKSTMAGPLSGPNDHIRNWMVRLCTLVNRHLASRINLALTDDSIALIEAAELDGFKARNIVGALLDRLHRVVPESQLSKVGVADQVAVLRRFKRPKIWLFVDDLDATFQNTPFENIDLGTFFTACRYLAQDMDGLLFRITMRTDVWSIVRRFDESLDKVEQYVDEIHWPVLDFKELLYRRIRSQCDQLMVPAPKQKLPIADLQRHYFDMIFVPTMQWGEKQQETDRVIYTLSYERPRWAVQLCKLARESALRDGRTLISKSNIDEVWGEYGARRIKDLVAEHKHQCPQVEELLNGFRGAERLLTRDELFTWINSHVSEHIVTTIEGTQTRSPREIAHFLYRIGFIVGRSEGEDESYEHYSFNEMPDFLTSRTDDDFGIKWEIHPCYRQALDIRKVDKSHRRGFNRRRRTSVD